MDAGVIVERLGMRPHPEGGFFVETHRDPDPAGGRGAVTAIYFLLDRGQRSHWHKVDATEIWLWHAGGPLLLRLSDNGRDTVTRRLGIDLARGEAPQIAVPKGAWQAAEPIDGWALVSCIVAPAFRFEGFTLAPPGWTPGGAHEPSTVR